MALDNLLENEAQLEIDAIRKEAQTKARLIIEEAQTKAREQIESRQRLLEKDYQAGIVRARSAADLEINASSLNASEEGISQVYALAEQKLRDISSSNDYPNILLVLLNEARQSFPNAEVVEVNPSDVDVFKLIFNDLPVIANPKVVGGVRLSANNGKSSISNTLGNRLQALRSELTPHIRRALLQ